MIYLLRRYILTHIIGTYIKKILVENCIPNNVCYMIRIYIICSFIELHQSMDCGDEKLRFIRNIPRTNANKPCKEYGASENLK